MLLRGVDQTGDSVTELLLSGRHAPEHARGAGGPDCRGGRPGASHHQDAVIEIEVVHLSARARPSEAMFRRCWLMRSSTFRSVEHWNRCFAYQVFPQLWTEELS